MSTKPLTFAAAALQILTEAGEPLHYLEILKRAQDAGLLSTEGKTPSRTLNAALSVNLRSQDTPFLRFDRGIFGLRGRDTAPPGSEVSPTGQEDPRRVRVPQYPKYQELRALLPLLEGVPRSRMLQLEGAIRSVRGTPQAQKDWSQPDEWITERLPEECRDLASRVWQDSNHLLNPRYTKWPLRLAEFYRLVEESAGVLRLTDRGKSFLDSPLGQVEQEIDEREGLLHILTLISEAGTAARSDLAEPWHEYMLRVSLFKSEVSAAQFLSKRQANLVARGLLERSGKTYQLTDQGLEYLNTVGQELSGGLDPEEPDLARLIREQQTSVKASIREALESLDPYLFERLIQRLLDAMGYSNTETTSPSNDKGVDVIGEIKVGITSVREVIQVKRHKAKIQRKDLDALRGSLHRFDAVRGTLITSGDFSKGTVAAAFEKGAAPITLINGENLVELLLENDLGVRKKKVTLWEFDAASLAESDETGEEG